VSEKGFAGSRSRIVVVDDHPIIRSGLCALIDQEPDMQVCGQAETAADAMHLVRTVRPDAAVIDVGLRDSSGLDLLRMIRHEAPHLPVLVFSMHAEEFYAERVLRAGAKGYISKAQPPQEVLTAIRRLCGGGVYISETMTGNLLSRLVGSKAPQHAIGRLSDRELEVLGLLGRGLSTRDVAQKLHRSVKTIESHRESIKKKLDLDNAGELLRVAVQWVQSGAQA
jgi:DNA-binding NarL/FixJ family response regulator